MNLFDGTDLLETTSTEIKNRILKPGQMLRAIDTGALYYGDKDGRPTAFVGTTTNSSGGLGIPAAANGQASLVTQSGYEERILTTPQIKDNRIVAVDYLPYLALAENSKWIMAKSDGADTTCQRVVRADGSITAGVVSTTLYREDGSTSLSANSIFYSAFAWDDFQILQFQDFTTKVFYLYKSVDGGLTCGANAPLYNDSKPVYCVGWNSSQTVAASEVMIMAGWSVARGKNSRGEDLLVFGQYNVNTSRTAGGANDWSNVLCSRRGGDVGTWEVVLEANTAGTTIVRHCHAVLYDPYTAEFWICYGDQQSSATYVWDGVRAIPANTRARDAAQYKGWRGMDMANNPTGDYNTGQLTIVFFTPDEVIAPIDHGFTGARGVYSLSRDLTKFEKIWDGASNGLPINHSLYSGCIDPVTGVAVVGDLIETGATNADTDWTLYVMTATKAGRYRDWKVSARYMLDVTRTSGRNHNVFRARADGSILIGCSNGAGKAYHSTSVCKISGVWNGRDMEVLHPVWWVDPVSGADTNDGRRPSAAFKTVKYALTGNRVTYSSLVNFMPGLSEEGTAGYTPGYNTTLRQPQTTWPVWVRGAGRKASVHKLDTVGAAISAGAGSLPLRFSGMGLTNSLAGTIFSTAAAVPNVTGAGVEFDDVYVSSGSVFVRQDSAKVTIREFDADLSTNGQLLRAEFNTAAIDATVRSGVVRGGKFAVGWIGNASSSCVVENVTGIAQTQCLVDVQATATVLPTVRNCAEDAVVPVVRDSRSTKTDATNVGYNVGRAASTGLQNGDVGSQTVASLGLIGTSGMPGPTSPLLRAGLASAGQAYDAVGSRFDTPKNVGAFA